MSQFRRGFVKMVSQRRHIFVLDSSKLRRSEDVGYINFLRYNVPSTIHILPPRQTGQVWSLRRTIGEYMEYSSGALQPSLKGRVASSIEQTSLGISNTVFKQNCNLPLSEILPKQHFLSKI